MPMNFSSNLIPILSKLIGNLQISRAKTFCGRWRHPLETRHRPDPSHSILEKVSAHDAAHIIFSGKLTNCLTLISGIGEVQEEIHI